MAFVHECDDDGNVLKILSIQENKTLWDLRMRECKDALGQAEFDCIVKDFYNNNDASFRDIDSESSSSGSSL